MLRLPIQKASIIDKKARITGNDYKHIVRVLRLGPGDEITLFDEDSYEHRGIISDVNVRELRLNILESIRVNRESKVSITLLQGLPKGDKMDLIVEKATEMGVNTIVPVMTERSQVRKTRKLKRWQRIAIESSKQCGRVKPPRIDEEKKFKEAIKCNSNIGLRLIFYENTKVSLREFIRIYTEVPKNIVLFIGPEGGFSKDEVDLALKSGFVPLSLGPRIFRTETASIVALSILQYLYGDL